MSLTLREASKDTLQAENKTQRYYSLPLAARTLGDISRLPKSLKVLLENLLRWQDGDSVTEEDIRALAGWLKMLMQTEKLPIARRGADAGFHRRTSGCGFGCHA